MRHVVIVAMFVGCSSSKASAPEPHPCDPVPAHFSELARAATADPDTRSTHPLLSKLEPTVLAECKKEWTDEQRACFLAAGEPAAALACVPARPDSAEPDEAATLPAHPAAPVVVGETCATPEGQLLRCLHRVGSGNRPKSVRFTPDGRELWAALHYDRPAVGIYDATTWQLIASVDLGEYGAVEMAFSHDGKRGYVSQLETASVYEIDVDTRAVLRTLATRSEGSKVVAVSADDRTLFVANWDGHEVSEFDLATGKLRRQLRVSGIPRGLYPTNDGKHLYVTGFDPGTIYKIDLATGRAESIYDQGGAVRHIVADERRGVLYLSDMGQDKILTVDLATDEVAVLAQTDHTPNTIALSPDGRVLFVSNRGENNPQSFLLAGPEWGSILAIDTTTGELLDAIVTGNQATGLDVSPDGTTLAGSDFRDNAINVYAIPPSDDLVAGGGGRAGAYKADLSKKDWRGDAAEAESNPQLLRKKIRDEKYPELRYSPPGPTPRPAPTSPTAP